MTDTGNFKTLILRRLAELGQRIDEIDAELGHELNKDLEDQAVDLEDDEVLERLGFAAQQEVTLLNTALRRIEDGTYGICQTCGADISPERQNAVLYTPLCRTCAVAASA